MTLAADLMARARRAERAAVARLLSIVENDEADAAEIVRSTHSETGRAAIVGITGPPGAGKSSLVSVLIEHYRTSCDRVAVVAVDPSSPFTGGAILGDRVRMRDQFLDEGVFIRSMASRGNPGGVARATGRVVNLLDALGFDVILVETVGVGQEEIDVIRVVDTVCLVTIPGAGDDIQAIKSGIIEIADVLVVNKADRPGADQAVKELRQMLGLGSPRLNWTVPIVKTSAADGSGIEELVGAIDEHRRWAVESGEKVKRRLAAATSELHTLLRERVLLQLAKDVSEGALEAWAAKVAAGALDPYAAVDEVLSKCGAPEAPVVKSERRRPSTPAAQRRPLQRNCGDRP